MNIDVTSGQGRGKDTHTGRAPPREGAAEAEVPRERRGPLARRHQRVGFTALVVALALGTALEGLLGFKAPSYLLDPLRRELWSLAHFHGALFGVVNLAVAPWADRSELLPKLGRAASIALVLATVLLPAGFFGGGIGHPEGDPSVVIVLVPLGALAAIFALTVHAVAAWRTR